MLEQIAAITVYAPPIKIICIDNNEKKNHFPKTKTIPCLDSIKAYLQTNFSIEFKILRQNYCKPSRDFMFFEKKKSLIFVLLFGC